MQLRLLVRDPLFWCSLSAYLALFMLVGNATDDDNAASKDIGFSAYILWAKLLSGLSLTWFAPAIYGAAFAWLLTEALRRRHWSIVLFFCNPFVIANICDVYNRFLLSILLASVLARAIHGARFWAATSAAAALAALHPINVAFMAFLVSPFAAFFVPTMFSVFQDLVPWEIMNELFPDKVRLYQQFGDNISLYAGGNFQIAQDILTEGNTLQRIAASGLPGVYTANPLWWHAPLAIMIAIWYVSIFWVARNRLAIALVTISTIGTLALAVGNSAVLARHFLPLFYLALALFAERPANGSSLLGLASVWGRLSVSGAHARSRR